ncbi:hypothetical protein [Actinoplanes sp. NPDC051851]|uniref:hypothetical protein n=1 Tax=Actinoplanes sp. NPDC051851 TaxID=3154753 RepID=UPI003423A3E7
MSSAENAIDQAVTQHVRDEQWPGVVVGWVVCVALVDHDGQDETSSVGTIYLGGSLPSPVALGIVEASRLRMRQQFLADS